MRCFEPGLLVSYAASQRGITHKRARGRARDVRFTAHNALTNRLSKCAPPSRRVTRADAVYSCHTHTVTALQRGTRPPRRRSDGRRQANSRKRPKNSQEIRRRVAAPNAALNRMGLLLPLAWTLLASAHRSKFDGLYEYQNYTPLTFLLSGLVMDFLKLPALYVAEHGFRVDQALLRKVELYGSMYMTAWLGIGFIAAASASSVLHDEFGGASTCGPSNGTPSAKTQGVLLLC